MINGAPAPLENTIDEVPGLFTIEPEVRDPIKNVEAALPFLMEIKVVEMYLEVASLTLPTVIEEEVLVAELSVLALLVEQVIIKVTIEEWPVVACLLVIEAMVEILLVAIELLVGEMAGKTMGMAAGEVVG